MDTEALVHPPNTGYCRRKLLRLRQARLVAASAAAAHTRDPSDDPFAHLRIGQEGLNAQFRNCPVVRYNYNTGVHSVHVRTSSVPVGMDACPNSWPDSPCTHCMDGITETGSRLQDGTCFVSMRGSAASPPHSLDFYFPPSDIQRVVIHNGGFGSSWQSTTTMLLGRAGWELWYLPASAGQQGMNSRDPHPYPSHWIKCFEDTTCECGTDPNWGCRVATCSSADSPTLNVPTIEVDCVASNVIGVRLVQHYLGSMYINEVQVY